MGVFKLPVAICNEVESIIARFWWSKGAAQGFIGKTGKHYANISRKEGWVFGTRMLKARYFPTTDFLSAQEDSSPSYTWQSILWCQELLLCGLRWRIGDGRLVQIYGDAWIPHSRIFMAQTASRVPMDTNMLAP
ncbi:PREDICTED: reverse mRNAase [Prunus dulcis]|uniref:PREDICTED: reverse mRNAase n=1 Tax=Prunus dulcis TaxID=3755 RepID=A0A5E4G5I1_PRUDU|nr:PREDICTED: reverse mRNAase [Prunus dulcis]